MVKFLSHYDILKQSTKKAKKKNKTFSFVIFFLRIEKLCQ